MSVEASAKLRRLRTLGLINFSCLQVIPVKQLYLKTISDGTMLSLQ